MLIYILLIFSIIIFSVPSALYKNQPQTVNISNIKGEDLFYKQNKLYYLIVSVCMILIIGLRNMTVGIDTMAYFNSYSSYSNTSYSYLLTNEIIEPGYAFIQILFNKLHINFQGFLIIIACFYIGTISYIIFKYSKNPCFSYLIFIAFGYFTFSMSTIRQTIAISFIIIAFVAAKNKKPVKFLIFVFIAAAFHITAVIYLPVYFMFKIKLSKKALFFFFIFGLTIYALKDFLREILNAFAQTEYLYIKTGGTLTYVFLIGTVIISLLFIKSDSDFFSENYTFFYMMICSVLLFPIVRFNPAVLRLNLYFSVFMIIYIPNMLNGIKDILAKYFGYLAYLSVLAYLFLTQTFSLQTKLTPYLFFWN